jgi:hypothetical protein
VAGDEQHGAGDFARVALARNISVILPSRSPERPTSSGLPVGRPSACGQLPSASHHSVALAARYRVPRILFLREFIEAGGLTSNSCRQGDALMLAGAYVGRIVNGEKPGDLPVQQPTRYEFVINLKTAKAFGLTIPPKDRGALEFAGGRQGSRVGFMAVRTTPREG